LRIISHRGFWTDLSEKNTLGAFHRSVKEQFGTETDFRDMNGELVVSHDPPTQETFLKTSELMNVFKGTGLILAVNVKSDGVARLIKDVMDSYRQEYFAFDMSGPQMRQYLQIGVPVYTRHSDIEPYPILYEDAVGVWLDDFEGNWISQATIREHLSASKKVCVVSSELHGRSHNDLWEMLRASGLSHTEHVTLCTDFPDQAADFFGGRK
jgi:glycerophosphoryl diester phosphodiesterase